MNNRHVQSYSNCSLAIRQEIQRFESVHPSIYAIYDIIELIPDPVIAQQIREHVVCIEDSFVNSQEWTLSRSVPDLRLGIVGSLSSGKSALVHRYLTGSYMQEESPEGGRFKKEIVIEGQSYLLLIRDEGGPPELQFTSWVDAVIFVFSLENESSFNAIYNYFAKMAHFRNTHEVPLILVGTQDAISETNPRVIDDGRARKLASDLKRCSYYETCATYGLNVDRVFHDACTKIVAQRFQQGLTPNNSRPSTPTHLLRYPSNNGFTPVPPFPPNIPPPQPPPAPNQGSSLSGSSPSHLFSSTSNKDGTLRNLHSGGAELTAMTRTDSFRDDGFKRVSAPVSSNVFLVPPQSSSQTNSHTSDSISRESIGGTKDLPTPSSTPTTSRKSRRKSNLFAPSKKNDDRNKNGEVGSGRAIPIKQGYLYKKSNKGLNKEWKKKYVTLCDDGKLTYHASLHDYMEDVHGKEISLQYTTVKVPGMKPRGSKVVGVDPPVDINGLTLSSSAPSSTGIQGRMSLGGGTTKDKVTLTSYETFHDNQGLNGMEGSLSSRIETPNVKKRHRRMKSSGVKNAECEESDDYEFSIVSLDNKQWLFEACSQDERDEWVAAIEQQILASLQGNESNKTRGKITQPVDPQVIAMLKNQIEGNSKCVDCDAPNPEWASINLGCVMCIECSGIHRNLGSHISKVRSLDLDEWLPGPLSVMKALGNEVVNNIWESRTRGYPHPKPNPRSTREEKERWIRAKYEAKEFLCLPQQGMSLHEQMVDSVCCGDVRRLAALIPHCGPEGINAPLNSPRDTRTLIHLSAAVPSLACTQLLLWHSAKVDVLDTEGRSCMYYAQSAKNKDRDVIHLLVQNGCPEAATTPCTQLMQGHPLGQHPSVNARPDYLSKVPFEVPEPRPSLYCTRPTSDKELVEHMIKNRVQESNSSGEVLHSASAQVPPGCPQASTLPRSKGSISRKPEILDKLQASVI